MKSKIVEIDVSPRSTLLTHHAYVNLLALLGLQIDHNRPQVFAFSAGDFEKYLVGIGPHQFHARHGTRTARDQKTAIRMRDFERGGSQRPLWIISASLVTANPIFPLV